VKRGEILKNKVSIIMGIYNCESSIEKCIQSILNQSYQDWELLMCDDGSTDRTYEIASRFVEKDERVKLINNPNNMGLARSLNHCLNKSTGEFIMRHDGDDLMVEDRIEKQVHYMNTHECDACGAGAYLFDKDGVWGRRQPIMNPPKEIMIVDGPYIHPTLMMKRSKLLEVGGYSDNKITRQRLEDYDLWLKFYEKGFILHNIQEPLIYFREDKDSFSRKSRKFRVTETVARLDACRRLNIPLYKRIIALKPLIVMLIPKKALRKYQTWRISRYTNSIKNTYGENKSNLLR
jgi:glycosyltransferase EpsE